MHPLSPDLSNLNDEELLKKINDLYDRLKMSYNWSNYTISNQLRMLLDDYQNEYNRRMAEQAEKFAQQNKKITDKIDIQ